MNTKTTFITLVLVVFSFTTLNAYPDVRPEITNLVKARISTLPNERKQSIDDFIKSEPHQKREASAFLFAFMPQRDLDTLPLNLIKSTIDFAFLAREKFIWAKNIPLSIFYNDVLPYASMDETRENWREPLFNMLEPIVKNSNNIYVAIDTINKVLKDLVKVEYNTKRKKPNQSPTESMAINMASCSGLSILLTDALRSVGIPSRIAGTPLWMSKDGNHNWCEVWIEGKWYCIEYYPAPLNSGWILPKCAEFEGQQDPNHQVYATSFAPEYIVSSDFHETNTNNSESIHFPMVWAEEDKSIHGLNVTQRYIDLYKSTINNDKSKNMFELSISIIKEGGNKNSSADRVSINVQVFDENMNELAQGESKGATADMNDILTFELPKAKNYIIKYGENSSTIKRKDKSKLTVYYIAK